MDLPFLSLFRLRRRSFVKDTLSFLHSGDGVKLTTRVLFLKVTDGTNGDDVGVEEADDGDVHGESG